MAEESLSNDRTSFTEESWSCMMEVRPLVWHHNEQPVNLDSAIIVNYKFGNSDCFKQLFCGIKKLYIASYSSDLCVNCQKDFFNHVNCFSNLEHFEMFCAKSKEWY